METDDDDDDDDDDDEKEELEVEDVDRVTRSEFVTHAAGDDSTSLEQEVEDFDLDEAEVAPVPNDAP